VQLDNPQCSEIRALSSAKRSYVLYMSAIVLSGLEDVWESVKFEFCFHLCMLFAECITGVCDD